MSFINYSISKILNFIVILFVLCISVSAKSAIEPNDTLKTEIIHFGVCSYLGYERTYEQYRPIVDYLNSVLKEEKIELHVMTMPEIYRGIENHTIDLVTTNPTHFLVIRENFNLSGAIATLVNKSQTGIPTSNLGGVILTKASRKDINNISDIRGKIIVAPSPENMGGYRSQVYELKKHGIDLPSDTKELKFSVTHQKAVNMLLDGQCDVAFVRTGVIEELVAKGELVLDSIKILNKKEFKYFPFLCSTQLYPEWPIFALPHLEELHLRHIVSALFTLEPDNPNAIKSGIYGYTVPLDYLVVENLARELRLAPFDKTPDFNIIDVWDKYHNVLWIFSLIAMVMIVYLFLNYRNKIIQKNESDKYKRLLSSIDEGVYGVDKHGNCTFINDFALNELGYNRDEIIGKNIHNLLFINFKEYVPIPFADNQLNISLEDGKTRLDEPFYCKKDGSFMRVESLISPIIENGTITGAIVSYRNITKRKEIEYHNKRLSHAIEQSPVSVIITDLDGNIEYINPAFEKVSGYTLYEVKGQNPRILKSGLVPDELYKELWDTLTNSMQWKGIFHNKRKDGTLYWESAIISPITNDDNQITHYIGIKEDITASKESEERLNKFAQELERSNLDLTSEIENRKEIEKKLLENERKLQRIFDILPVGITISDEQGYIVENNIASEIIFGVRINKSIKKKISEFDLNIIRKDGSLMPVEELASSRSLKENKYIQDVVLGIKNLEREVVWLNVSAIPLDLEGFGVLVLHVDITAIVNAENELLETNENMRFNQLTLEENQFELNKTIHELEMTRIELEAINATKDKFFSIIAHDLRSPFSGFLGLTQIISEDIYNISMKELKEFAEILKDSAQNLYQLLENLLEWALMQKESKPFNPDIINLFMIADKNADIYSAKSSDKDLSIVVHISKEIEVTADANMLNGIFRNLISNAGKFTPEGGTITISAAEFDDFIEISVSDTGIGMSPDLLSKLFALGEKTSRPGTSGESSTGLGLILCKEYVEKHGGRIWAESEEDKGSIFKFTLPKNLNV